MKIFLENLVLQGIHGATAKEMERIQPFRVDIEAECGSLNLGEDRIEETLDYRLMKKIAEKVVREERWVLLETIALRIAEKVKIDPRVERVRVSVRKLAIWTNGVPGVEVEL